VNALDGFRNSDSAFLPHQQILSLKQLWKQLQSVASYLKVSARHSTSYNQLQAQTGLLMHGT
jgi:hypothetical protein